MSSSQSPWSVLSAHRDRPLAALSPTAVAAAAASAAEHAAEADRARELNSETVRLLTGAGLARHFVPRALGGTEGTFSSLLAAVAEVGESCASAAWCGALWAAHGRFASYLPPAGRRELWSVTPDVLISAVVKPSGGLRRTGTGWLLSGEWACASGVGYADWLLLAAAETGERGAPCRMLAVPRAEVAVRDTWRSDGMRGTGSNTVVVDSVRVPEHRTFLMADLMAGTPGPGRARCHTAPARLSGGLMFCAPALGAARSALDQWSRRVAHGQSAQELSAYQERRLHHVLACSADEIEAAQLLLQDAARRADAANRTERDVVRNTRIAAGAAQLLNRGVERLYRAGAVGARNGGTATRPGQDVADRCRRDVRTIAGHRVLRREPAATGYAISVFSALAPARVPGVSGAHA